MSVSEHASSFLHLLNHQLEYKAKPVVISSYIQNHELCVCVCVLHSAMSEEALVDLSDVLSIDPHILATAPSGTQTLLHHHHPPLPSRVF